MENENEKLNKARNNLGIKGETDYVLGQIDQSQISRDSEKGSDFDVQKEADKESAIGYGKLDKVADSDRAHSDANPIIPNSMKRYCHDHTAKLESMDELKGEHKTKRLKVAKTDDTAKGE